MRTRNLLWVSLVGAFLVAHLLWLRMSLPAFLASNVFALGAFLSGLVED